MNNQMFFTTAIDNDNVIAVIFDFLCIMSKIKTIPIWKYI